MHEPKLLRATLRLERQSQSELKSDRNDYARAVREKRDAEDAHATAYEHLNEAYASWPGARSTRLDPEALQRFSAWIGVQETRVAETSARADSASLQAETAARRLAFSKARSDILAERARTLRRKLSKRREERQMADLEIVYAYRAVRS